MENPNQWDGATTVKEFDGLYSLDRNGKIRYFNVFVIERENSEFFIVTNTGLLKGKLTTKETRGSIGKQGRNRKEQAIFEAQSKWNEKHDEGYKSMLDLSLKANVMDVDLAEGMSIADIYRDLGIVYNTDTRWYPLPMLANKYGDVKKHKFPYIAQPKLNGVRCQILYDLDKEQVVLNSRGGKSYIIPHIINQVTPFMLLNQNLVLDGELYLHGKSLQEINGAANKETDAPTWLEFHMYDCYELPNPKKTLRERLAHLRVCYEVLTGQFNATSIFRVRSVNVENLASAQIRHDYCVNEGYEGLMLKDPDSLYEISFRTNAMLKMKEFEDEEFEIVHCEVDLNVGIGESFVFVLQNNINDAVFRARPMGSITEKEGWYANIRNLVGKKCTVRFQERTKDGIPHQGHVRKDKSKCLTIELVDR